MANQVKVITSDFGTKVYTVNMLAVAGTFTDEVLPVPPGYRLKLVNHTPVVAATATTDLSITDSITGVALVTTTDLGTALSNLLPVAITDDYITLGNSTISVTNNAVAAANIILTLVYTTEI